MALRARAHPPRLTSLAPLRLPLRPKHRRGQPKMTDTRGFTEACGIVRSSRTDAMT